MIHTRPFRRPSLSVLACLSWAFVLCAALLPACRSFPRAPALAQCEALEGRTLPPGEIGLPTQGALIEDATMIAATARGNGDGEYCRITGAIKAVRTDTPDIRFEVNLPSHWNGRALQMGGAGYNGEVQRGLGTVSYAADRAPLAEGYVTFGSDSGHVGNAARADFALNDEAVANFGYAHIKKTHDVALALIRLGYGQGPLKTFYVGGSTGGREGYTAIERFPGDYDGVIANAPAINFSGVRLIGLEIGRKIYGNTDGFLPPDKQKLVHARVLAECDALDGAKDGIVSDVEACRAREAQTIASLRCSPDVSAAGTRGAGDVRQGGGARQGDDAPRAGNTPQGDIDSLLDISHAGGAPASEPAPSKVTRRADAMAKTLGTAPEQRCLSDAQIATMKALRDGLSLPYPLAYGVTRYPGYNVFEGSDMSGMLGLGASPLLTSPPTFATNGYLFSQGDAYFKYFVTRDKMESGIDFDPAQPGVYRQRLVDLSSTVGAMNPDMSAFIARGGKLITLQGLADEVISPNQTIAYYHALVTRYGQATVDSFMRLYMVPGYQHGNGVFIPSWDALNALDAWVSRGTAPGALVATDVAPATIGRSRPLCVFPAFPRYRGNGDVNAAASFDCSTL
jgi:Tannase and feruloyl esterase